MLKMLQKVTPPKTLKVIDMAKLIKASGETKEIAPSNNVRFELEEAQSFVRGYIQIIPIGNNEVMVLDEEGKLKDKPFNEAATLLAKSKKAIFSADFIVGDVILCKDEEI